jgi:nucleoside-diphosphate-sugar epimerase
LESLVAGDIADERLMRHLLPGTRLVFNLAGRGGHLESVRDPLGDAAANCAAHLAFLEACRLYASKARVVYTSTRQVYGRVQRLPVGENHPVQPLDINGIHKHAAELYHLQYSRLHGLRSAVVRLTNVYGPGMWTQDGRHCFIGHWIGNVLAHHPVQVYGDGRQKRDLNDVDDVVDALLRLGAAGRRVDGRIYNLGAPEALSLVEIAAMLVRLSRSHAGYCLVPFPAEIERIEMGDYQGDYSLIHQHVGWKPKVSLEKGLQRAIALFKTGYEEIAE